MTLEVRPYGVRCNIGCQYCYQNPERDAGNVASGYDLDKIFAAIEAEDDQFSLFGGEPLLMPEADLERLWAWGAERYGYNAVQTNGTLVNDRHIELFERYGVRVGISIDGPGELNDVRWAGSLEKTRELTARTLETIGRLCAKGSPPGLIITLHRGNASPERLPRLLEWVREVAAAGVRSVRVHLLEIDSEAVRERYSLTDQENLEAMRGFYELEKDMPGLHLDVFDDIRKLLRGDDTNVTCTWNGCDPFTTRAVQGIEGNGQRSNCGRTNKDGVDFVKADVAGYERYLALYHTPQESGGCGGCRFFLMCKGQCPGTAIDGDWRNRTAHCEVWKGLLTQIESELVEKGEAPLSLSPHRKAIEGDFVEAWGRGSGAELGTLVSRRLSTESETGSPSREQVLASEGVGG